MPIHKVQTPNGELIQVEAPEGASDEAILEFAQSQFSGPKFEVGGNTNNPDQTSQWTDEAIGGIKRSPQNFAGGVVDTVARVGKPLSRPIEKMLPQNIQHFLQNTRDKTSTLRNEYIDEESAPFAVGKMATAALATRGLGAGVQTVGQAAKLPMLARFGEAAKTAGLSGGGLPMRAAGGAAFGATSSAMEGGNPVFGGMVGGALPIVGAGLKGAAGFGNRLFGDAEKRASRLAYDATDDPQAAIRNLMSQKSPVPNEPITAGEASGDLGLLSLQNKLAVKSPEVKDKIARMDFERRAARERYIANEAGTPADIEAMKLARDKTTGQQRNVELEAANTAGRINPGLEKKIADKTVSAIQALQLKGRMQTEAAQAANRAENFTPVNGMPRISSRYSPNMDRVPEYKGAASDAGKIESQRKAERDFAQSMLDSVAAHGLSPLKSDAVTQRIDAVLATPGLRSNDVVSKSLGSIRDKIKLFSNESGVIDARDLYTIRKEVGSVIKGHAKDSNNWDKRLASGLEGDVQKYIDDAIEGAGGDGWKKYLADYREKTIPIKQKEAFQEAYEKIKAGGADLQGNKILGGTNLGNLLKDGEFKTKLSPQQLQVLENIHSSLNTQSKAAAHGVSGIGSNTVDKLSAVSALEKAAEGKLASRIPIPGLNPMISALRQRAADKTMGVLEQALPDPQETLRLLEKAKRDRLPKPVIQMLEKKARQAYPLLPAAPGLLGGGE